MIPFREWGVYADLETYGTKLHRQRWEKVDGASAAGAVRPLRAGPSPLLFHSDFGYGEFDESLSRLFVFRTELKGLFVVLHCIVVLL